jgi:16S rRNA (guanine527-N7)-methyltransferase
LGSGAGLPGLVLAIMLAETAPQAHVHMVESDRKKVNFLRTVLRDTGVAASVHHGRIEAVLSAPPQGLAQIDVVTARALAPLTDLAAYMAPIFNSSTIALLHKGRDWQEELTQMQKFWTMLVETHVSRTDAAARIIEIKQLVSRTHAGQPAAF